MSSRGFHRFIVAILVLPLLALDRLNEALFQRWFRLTVRIYGLFEGQRGSASVTTVHYRCVSSNFRLQCLMTRRGLRRYVPEARHMFTQPAILLSVHSNFSLISALHILNGLPIANVVRFPERLDHTWRLYDAVVGDRPHVIAVKRGVLSEVSKTVLNGSSVTLYPDAGDKINPSCFRLIEEGIPVGFYYGSISPNGVLEFVYRHYDGPARAQDCAEAFLAFLRDDCHLSNPFYLSR